MPSRGYGQEGPKSSNGLPEGTHSRKGGAHTQASGGTEQEATPAQAPEPAGPVIELVEITDQDLDSIILYDGFAL